ncbi:MAG: FAD-binding protein [Steroidobacteraceae bacterium]
MLRYWLDIPWRFRTKRDRRPVWAARSSVACVTRCCSGIPLWLECPMNRLSPKRAACAASARRNGHPVTLGARRAVILAAGGFERNQAMREQYLPHPTRQEWSGTPAGLNTGDTIRAAEAIGAKLEKMDLSWGTPSVRNTAVPQGAQPVFAERGFGGSAGQALRQ